MMPLGSRPMSYGRRVSQRAFTLIEILVVVAIIALLVAILLPSLARARNQAKSAICLSNLKQMGLGLTFYREDSKGFLPPYRLVRPVNNNPNDAQNFPYWFQYLPFKYLAGNYDVTVCPMDDLIDVSTGGKRGPYARLVKGTNKPGPLDFYLSYGANENTPRSAILVYPTSMVYAPEAIPERFNPSIVSRIRQPTKLMFLLETRSSGLVNPPSPLSYFRYNHGGPPTKMNLLYADGHSAPCDIRDIWPAYTSPPPQAPRAPSPSIQGDGKFLALWYGDPTYDPNNPPNY